MFGESNSDTAGSIGPSRRGLWIGVGVGCLLLATTALLVSGTVDGLNFFGARLADTTPNFPDPPRDEDARNPQRPGSQISTQSPTVTTQSPTLTTQSLTGTAQSSRAATQSPALTSQSPALVSTPNTPRIASAGAPARTPCFRPGYAAVLDPASEPVGTALARSLSASDLQTRIIVLADASAAGGETTKDTLGRQDVDRILAGDGSVVTGRIKEGIFLIAQLKVQVRQTVIAESQMTEVGGTMDLTIVRNLCGTITVERHPDIYGRSVNETLDDGIRGLGEIFKEKIADLAARSLGDNNPGRKPGE